MIIQEYKKNDLADDSDEEKKNHQGPVSRKAQKPFGSVKPLQNRKPSRMLRKPKQDLLLSDGTFLKVCQSRAIPLQIPVKQ